MTKAVIFDMFETLVTHYESPLYFGAEISRDMGITFEEFRELWVPYEHDRTVGRLPLEELIKQIMDAKHIDSEEIFSKVISKRKNAKRECFAHIHPDILPLFEELKRRGTKIGLITNCFSEEEEVIRESVLFSYFDVAMLSNVEGVCKPDHEIFFRCMKQLGVKPEECIYVGDGGSKELETAAELGMQPLQALWYLKEGTSQPLRKKEGFTHLYHPMEVLQYCEKPHVNM